MQVTLFGWLYMPLLLAVAMWARPWLLGLVLGSAVFQAAAVVNLPMGTGNHGISPYIVSAGVAGLVMLWRLLGPDKSPISPPAHLRTPSICFLIYAAVAVVGSFVLPYVYAGTPVQPPLDPNGYSLTEFPPLRWSISNLAQSINLCIHVVVACFIWQTIKRADWSVRKTIVAFGTATAVAALAGLHDRIALLLEWPRMAPFWMSNLGYGQVDNAVNWVPYSTPGVDGSTHFKLHRISSPFSEPSYGSAFFAAIYAGVLAATLFDRQRSIFLLAALLATALALINTTGSTGLAAGFVSTFLLLAGLVLKRVWTLFATKSHAATLRKHFSVVAVGLIAAISALWLSPIARTLPGITQVFVINKVGTLEKNARYLSDMRALSLTRKTLGMGAGMGSNRTSSFVTSMLSNTGVVGSTAFLMMVVTLIWRAMRTPKISPVPANRYFVAGALFTCLLSVSLAIPDLNLPFLWAFVFLAFSLSPQTETSDTSVAASA